MNDADIDAPEGWDLRTSAGSVIVAVTDSGIRYTHDDLDDNMWVNPGEVPGNSTDDDGNGYKDDVYGMNATISASLPSDSFDDLGHGTHVAGTVGAEGNNGLGVVGVAWGVKLMAVKIFNNVNNGETSDSWILDGFNYAIKNGASIINASWAGSGYSQSIRDVIAVARNRGVSLVSAASNSLGNNNDSNPRYTASYDLDNIVAVTATTRSDTLPCYANFGLMSVHLAAPGGNGDLCGQDNSEGIYSTAYHSDTVYQARHGTSMAVPHVSGALALLKAHFPFEHYLQLKNRLLSTTDPLAALDGKCQTGGRLNLYGALNSSSSAPPNNTFSKAFKIQLPSGASTFTFTANNVDATKETSEPNHAGNSGGKSVWWKWTAPSTNSITFKTLGSGFDTLLAVYTGSSVSGLTTIQSNDDGGQGGSSQLTFNPSNGVTYYVAVDGKDGAAGTVKLTIQTSSTAQPTELKFTLSSLARSSGQFQATLTGPGSASVTVQTTDDLNAAWQDKSTFTLSGGGSYSYTDTTASGSIRFYRARVGTITSPSQLSVNVVGYVDRTVPSGWSMHAHPFNAHDHDLDTVLASVPNGTEAFQWDVGLQAWDSNVFVSGAWDTPGWTLAPEGGVALRSYATNNFTVSFVGEVAQGYRANTVPDDYAVRSSRVPEAGRVAGWLQFPAVSGDKVHKMKLDGTWDTYTLSGSAWSPSEPSIAIGESFFSEKGQSLLWRRNFLIWP